MNKIKMKILSNKNKSKLKKLMKKKRLESPANLSPSQKYFLKRAIFKTNIKSIQLNKITKILIKRRKKPIKVKRIKNNKAMNKNHNYKNLKNKFNQISKIRQISQKSN
jgi:hypothetical protein